MFIESSSDTCYSKKTEKHDETLRASPNIEFVEPSEVIRGEGCDQDIKWYLLLRNRSATASAVIVTWDNSHGVMGMADGLVAWVRSIAPRALCQASVGMERGLY